MSGYKFPYLDANQSRSHEPTEWEISLAGALESAFAKGAYEISELIAALNASRVRPRNGGDWTEQGFRKTIQELGA